MAAIRVLNVAEKPSVARSASEILSNHGARSRVGPSRFNPIWEFGCTIQNQNCDMTFTSVAGHLMEIKFEGAYNKWNSCRPQELFHAPITKYVVDDKRQLETQLQQEARRAQWLVLWLDCDREGENIAAEVHDVCVAVNPQLRILRAKFSALTSADLHRAINTLTQLNWCGEMFLILCLAHLVSLCQAAA